MSRPKDEKEENNTPRGAAFDALREQLIAKDVDALCPQHFSESDRATVRQVAALLYLKSSVQTPYRSAIHYAVMCASGAVREMKQAT